MGDWHDKKRKGNGTNFLDQFVIWQDPANPGVKHIWFESCQDIIDCIREGNTSHWHDFPWTSNETACEWAGSKSMDEALHFLQWGWEEVADAIFLEDAALAVNREIEPEFVVTPDTSGGAVDIGNYLSGVPECMINFETKPRRKKTISILFNVCNSASRTQKSIIQRGHTVTCICDYLERSGYRVRIDVADTAYGGGWYGEGRKTHFTLAFCAKDYNQALDFGRIGFMLGSPAMLRRIFFGIEASSALWGKHYQESFGWVAPVHPKVGNFYDYVFDYNTPLNEQSATQCIEYILSGKATQVDITGSFYD